jgi:hypothetical protein
MMSFRSRAPGRKSVSQTSTRAWAAVDKHAPGRKDATPHTVLLLTPAQKQRADSPLEAAPRSIYGMHSRRSGQESTERGRPGSKFSNANSCFLLPSSRKNGSFADIQSVKIAGKLIILPLTR